MIMGENTYTAQVIPEAVTLYTVDFEIQGVVYVDRQTEPHRRMTDLLNNRDEPFLAVKDVRLTYRKHPSSPRHYAFLHVNVDHVVMIHPSAEATLPNTAYTEADSGRFDRFREKLTGGETHEPEIPRLED